GLSQDGFEVLSPLAIVLRFQRSGFRPAELIRSPFGPVGPPSVLAPSRFRLPARGVLARFGFVENDRRRVNLPLPLLATALPGASDAVRTCCRLAGVQPVEVQPYVTSFLLVSPYCRSGGRAALKLCCG